MLTAADRDKILSDRARCEEFFDIKVDVQNTIDALEVWANMGLSSIETTIEELRLNNARSSSRRVREMEVSASDVRTEAPVWVLAAALLCLKGVVKRPLGKPRDDYQTRRAKGRERWMARYEKPEPDPVVNHARARFKEIYKDIRARERIAPSGQRLGDLRQQAQLRAGQEAKDKFKSKLSAEQIAWRIDRPGSFP
jgi:hypothetical protein